MSQIQGRPCPPPPPRADIFSFFLSNSPPCGPFLWSNAPLPRIFFRGQMPLPPGLKWQNPDWFQETWTRFSTLPFLLFIVYQFNVHVHHFFFCVHSDHLGSRYELCAFGTLQSSVSRQEEVQEHESVHSKFLTQECFQKVRYHQDSTIGKEANPS